MQLNSHLNKHVDDLFVKGFTSMHFGYGGTLIALLRLSYRNFLTVDEVALQWRATTSLVGVSPSCSMVERPFTVCFPAWRFPGNVRT